MPKPVVIFGASEIARAANTYFTHDSDYKVVAFTVDAAYIKQDNLSGLPVIAFEEIEQQFAPSDYNMFVALGYQQICRTRQAKFHAAKAKGYGLVSYVCSRASLFPGNNIGENCFVGEMSVLQAHAKLGNNVWVWSGNLIGHDVVVGDHCFISSHVVIGGNATVGQRCFFGMNAVVRDGIRIADECIIGAQAWVSKDTEPNDVYSAPPTPKYHKRSDEVRI
jgi:sugar O-acyltransferase (sialic acid O-acetyltransferase NeuD family)